MPKKHDSTERKVREQIEVLEKEIAEKQIAINTLKNLLDDEVVDPKPTGFVLTKAITKSLEKRDSWVSVDDVLADIANEWDGYKPLKRSIQITLNSWVKSGKINKDQNRSGYYSKK